METFCASQRLRHGVAIFPVRVGETEKWRNTKQEQQQLDQTGRWLAGSLGRWWEEKGPGQAQAQAKLSQAKTRDGFVVQRSA